MLPLIASLFLLLGLIPSVHACGAGECDLDIYVWDQDDDALDANIYVDDSFEDYDDHITITVDVGTHTIEARKSDYDSDSVTITCSEYETEKVDLTLHREADEDEDISLDLDDLEVDPDEICEDEDETIELSIPVKLESGPDNTRVIVRFYVEDDDGDWDYIGKDEKELDEDQRKTFEIDYEYDADDLEDGRHDVKAVVAAGDEIETEYARLDVEDCNGDDLRINVDYINLDPSDPDKGDIVEVKVPVTLEDSIGSE